MQITREGIIAAISDDLCGNPSVHALWLEGADAHGLADDYSDIDLWLDVDDGMEDAAIESIRAIASAIGPIDYECDGGNVHPQIRQAFIHIHGTPEFWILDVCVQSHSRDVAFTNGFADERARVLFDRGRVIQYREPDWPVLHATQMRRTQELSERLVRSLSLVHKEIGRGRFLEALSYYHDGLLRPLVEILRIRYAPTKQAFYLKHVVRDLPAEIVAKLEYLYTISSLDDIRVKCEEAASVFRSAVQQTQD